MRIAFVLAALACLAVFGEAKAAQDQQHYEQALSQFSTSPSFVFVTIKNDMTGDSYTGCVSANLLTGAVFIELGGNLGPETDSVKRDASRALMLKAQETARKNTAHEFHFSNQAALSNIRLQYTEEDLAEARKAVDSLGLKVLASNAPERHSLGKLQRSAALACAIIEKGGGAREADITGEVYAEP